MTDMNDSPLVKRSIDELLSDVIEIEKLLAAREPRQYAAQVSVLAALIMESTSAGEVARLATSVRLKADRLAKNGRASIDLMKDAAFRLRISLLALKRGGSPVE